MFQKCLRLCSRQEHDPHSIARKFYLPYLSAITVGTNTIIPRGGGSGGSSPSVYLASATESLRLLSWTSEPNWVAIYRTRRSWRTTWATTTHSPLCTRSPASPITSSKNYRTERTAFKVNKYSINPLLTAKRDICHNWVKNPSYRWLQKSQDHLSDEADSRTLLPKHAWKKGLLKEKQQNRLYQTWNKAYWATYYMQGSTTAVCLELVKIILLQLPRGPSSVTFGTDLNALTEMVPTFRSMICNRRQTSWDEKKQWLKTCVHPS